MKKIVFSDSILQDFTRNFDFVEYKYRLNKLDRFDYSLQNKIYEYELGQQTNNLLKKDFGYIYDDVKLVYGDDNKVKKHIEVFCYTEQKIINEYLNIPGLNQMFSDKYFDFEWDMHTGRNFDEHKCNYYRDHFIHQVRDMHMAVSLLNDFDFYSSVKEILDNRRISKISYYCYTGKLKFLDELESNAKRNDLLRSCALVLNEDEQKYKIDYYYKYIITASSILAALFHDIGYPLGHFIKIRNRISKYMPSMYMFTHNDSDDFDRVASILNNSLLFQIVNNTEIKSRLNQNGKYDHGTYSAIAFLMQFYDAGVIYTLPIEKRIAIELAAVAIYNHTFKYKIQNQNEKSKYYQPVFSLNPIAYILRLCDDSQEWNRVYFEFSDHGDIQYCNKCNTPILRYSVIDYTDKKGYKVNFYKCACGEGFNKSDLFEKRRLYLVETSKELEICRDEKKRLCFKLDYDLFLLLRMSYLNHTYAKFRIKELNSQKLIMENQRFGNSCNRMCLLYFISGNPILLKTEILRRFLEKNKLSISKDTDINKDFIYDVYVSFGKDKKKEEFEQLY